MSYFVVILNNQKWIITHLKTINYRFCWKYISKNTLHGYSSTLGVKIFGIDLVIFLFPKHPKYSNGLFINHILSIYPVRHLEKFDIFDDEII